MLSFLHHCYAIVELNIVNFTFTEKFLFDFSIEENAEIKQIILLRNVMLLLLLVVVGFASLVATDLEIQSREFCLEIRLVPVRIL